MITIGLHGGGRMTVTEDGSVDVSQVTPRVLAFGLSHVTRFGGQAGPYSVAEHSVRMFDWAVEEFHGLDGPPLPLLRAILLHDGPECLGEGDTQRFVKLEYGCEGIRKYAHRVAEALWRKHGYGGPWDVQHTRLKVFDIRMGSVEARHFGFPYEPIPAAAYLPRFYRDGGWGYWTPDPWPAKVAEDEFLDRWGRC